MGAVLEAAKAVFADSGVDAPVREIAARAGVGVGTLYRHFPQRSDLVVAVFEHEIDECTSEAAVLAQECEPDEALVRWLHRYAELLGTKRGLAAALHSGDAAFDALPAYFDSRMQPALRSLLDAAAGAGAIRRDVDANDLLHAVAYLCMSADPGQSGRMLALLTDGLRYGASPT
jgi:AcrR family transcriptional regulator